jgi:hypothetical protein
MSDDEKVIITPEEAESLLVAGPLVHNFMVGPAMLLGCDYKRADAIEALKKATEIEIAGPIAKDMKHPIAVRQGDQVSFFEADMDKVAAFEAKRHNHG